MKPIHTEFDFLNRMYTDSQRVMRECLVCQGRLEKDEYAFCSNCRELLKEIEPDMAGIDFESHPELKLDTALAYLALQEVLPDLDQGQYWISWYSLVDALETKKHYRILKEIRPEFRVKAAISIAMNILGWSKEGRVNTYHRQNESGSNQQFGVIPA